MSKKVSIILVVIILITIAVFTACSMTDGSTTSDPNFNDNRFITTGDYYYINGTKYDIVMDKETNNLYLSYDGGGYWGPVLCPLYDKDGNIAKGD